jgi:hypothetical protein
LDPYEIALNLMDLALRAGNGLAAAKSDAFRIVKNEEAVERAAAEIARKFDIIEELDPAPISSELGSKWDTGPKPEDLYWPSYRDRLRAMGWVDAMIEILDRTTTRVVGQLEAPGNPKLTLGG